MPQQVLFLCTGNYYRSRFAEEMFNHLVRGAGIDWFATSLGLALETWNNIGPVSEHTQRALEARGIPIAEPIRFPRQVVEADLQAADLVIALKEAEHRHFLDQKFPGWSDRVRYWHVHDLDEAHAHEALPQIERHVQELIASLKDE